MADILKPLMIVLDPFWVKNCYAVTMRFIDIPEDEATHIEMCFSGEGFPAHFKIAAEGT